MSRIVSLLVFFVSLIVLQFCQPIDYEERVAGFKVYRIKAGGHSSYSKIASFRKDLLDFDVRFDSTAVYAIGEKQGDINKLYGFNDCGQDIYNHRFSARVGWNWHNDSLKLFSYTYNDGVRRTVFLQSIELGGTYNCKILITPGSYIFSIDGKTLDIAPRGCSDLSLSRKYLYPYFGGETPAPHEVVILLREN
jgi:hypothetical protein